MTHPTRDVGLFLFERQMPRTKCLEGNAIDNNPPIENLRKTRFGASANSDLSDFNF